MTQHIFGGSKISLFGRDSLANFVVLCPTYHENVIEIRLPIFSVMFLVSMDTENIKIKIVICLMFDLSWKFHENPFTCFSVMLLTDTDSSEKNRKRNHVCKGFNRTSPKSSRLFLVPSLTYPATFMKSVHAFSCDMDNRQANQQIWIKTYPLPLENNLRLSAEVKMIVNG